MKEGKDCLGNKVVLNNNNLFFYNKDRGNLLKIVHYSENKSANKEFVRITGSYRGHNGGGKKREHKKIYIHSIIIAL